MKLKTVCPRNYFSPGKMSLAILAMPGVIGAARAGGLDRGATLLTSVSAWMGTIGVSVVTIALMVVGFRMAFQAAEWKDVAPVFWGGVIIGSASAIAAMFVG